MDTADHIIPRSLGRPSRPDRGSIRTVATPEPDDDWSAWADVEEVDETEEGSGLIVTFGAPAPPPAAEPDDNPDWEWCDEEPSPAPGD